MGGFTPSTAPGCRAPHFRLADGSSLYDALGSDYTLLRFDAAVDAGPLSRAAEARGVPLALLDVAAGLAPAEYRHALVLVRADQHVAWRGDYCPATPETLIERLRGAVTESNDRMNTADLIAIDTHTHLEVSCRNPFDSYGEEYDRAADKYFRSSKRPTMEETIDFYRAKKIGFVNFTVDAETQIGRRRIPNEEIAEAAQANRTS